MVRQKKSNRRTQRRRQSNAGFSTGAGLMRFFDESGIGIKIKPITVVILSLTLVIVVILAHMNIFEWLF